MNKEKCTDTLGANLIVGDTVISIGKSNKKTYFTFGIITTIYNNILIIKTFKNDLTNQKIGTQSFIIKNNQCENLFKYRIPFDSLTTDEIARYNKINTIYIKDKV